MATPESQFQFLHHEWPMLFDPAVKAESLVYSDARSSCFYARRSMDARLLYDSPYTDFSVRGVDGVFESKEVDDLVSILEDVRKRALG